MISRIVPFLSGQSWLVAGATHPKTRLPDTGRPGERFAEASEVRKEPGVGCWVAEGARFGV